MAVTFRHVLTVGLVVVAVLLPSRVAAQTETPEYYGLDTTGSVRVVFDGSGAVLSRVDYGPFGEQLAAAPGAPNEKYAGLFRDEETGLDYAQARQYSPRTGRFTTVDPVYSGLFEPQRWNRYAYALNSPLTFVDPDGLDPANICPPGSYYCEVVNVKAPPPPQEITVQVFTFKGGYGHGSVTRAGSGTGSSGTQTNQQPPNNPPKVEAPDPEPPEKGRTECKAGFIRASNDAWIRSGAGFRETEAGFWVIGPNASSSYVPLPFTNQRGTITGLRVPPGASALVHTHPNSANPQPSSGDILNSNRSNLPFYVLSNRGLWVHEPGASSSTMARPGMTWQKPCQN